MMYELIRKSKFPVKELAEIIKDDNDILRCAVFGARKTYPENLELMSQKYIHPKTGEVMTFRPATSDESILIASRGFCFGNRKELDELTYEWYTGIFDEESEELSRKIPRPLSFFNYKKWLQIGVVMDNEGLFTNTKITNKSKLTRLLNNATKVNGIYLIDDKIAYVPYDSFTQEQGQSAEEFSKSTLARALEHTSRGVAKNLRKMVSPFKDGVDVVGFDPSDEPLHWFINLINFNHYNNKFNKDRNVVIITPMCLQLGGGITEYDSHDGEYSGYAFGILK